MGYMCSKAIRTISRSGATVTTQIDAEPNRSLGSAQLARSHENALFDWHLATSHDTSNFSLESDLDRLLSRLGTNQESYIHEYLATNPSSDGDSEDETDLNAVTAPRTLFQSSASIIDCTKRSSAQERRSLLLQYYLQHDEGVLPRLLGLDQPLNDTRGLLLNRHKYPRRPWRSDLRAILPGLQVIKCVSGQVVPAGPSCVYVALSYVWGPEEAGDEKHGFGTDLHGHHLPQTIRDAMNVVLVLGLDHLWVDRYCINNTEPATKHHMINNMDAIYEAAYLTIIAASGSDGKHGLPSVSRTLKALDEDATPPWDGIVYSEFSGPHLRQYQNSAYSTRGWTFQEDLLSQRRLIFTNDRATLYYGGEDRVRKAYGIFAHVNTYSLRSLSYPSDQLNAFLGVFRAYERLQPPVKHVLGLPFLLDRRAHMRQPGYGLLWRPNRSCSLSRVSGLPSWTWAGWNGWSAAGEDAVLRSYQPGPYGWLVDQVDVRRRAWVWAPSDICLEILIGSQLTEISEHFRVDHSPPSSGKSEEPAPVLHLTAWSTTVSVCVSPRACVRSSDKDLNDAAFTIDPTPASLHRGEPLVNGHWHCQWTAAIICWAVKKAGAKTVRTQCLLLEREGEDVFRRVGILETDWYKSDLDENGRVSALDRNFTRTRFRME